MVGSRIPESNRLNVPVIPTLEEFGTAKRNNDLSVELDGLESILLDQKLDCRRRKLELLAL